MEIIIGYILICIIGLVIIYKLLKSIIDKKKSTYKSYMIWESSLITKILFYLLIVSLISLIIYLRFLFTDFIDNFNFLNEKYKDIYFSSTIELFNISKLNNIKSSFIEGKNLTDMMNFINYTRSLHGLIVYINFIFFSFFLPLQILNSKYETIDTNGVHYRIFFIKWSKIKSYKWSKAKKSGSRKYYDLIIKTNENRFFFKYFFSKIKIKILKKDLEEIDSFLSENIV